MSDSHQNISAIMPCHLRSLRLDSYFGHHYPGTKFLGILMHIELLLPIALISFFEYDKNCYWQAEDWVQKRRSLEVYVPMKARYLYSSRIKKVVQVVLFSILQLLQVFNPLDASELFTFGSLWKKSWRLNILFWLQISFYIYVQINILVNKTKLHLCPRYGSLYIPELLTHLHAIFGVGWSQP